MKAQLAKGVAWLSAAKLLVNLLNLCSTFILARLLTPSDFGIVAMAMTVHAVMSAVTELSLSSALIHHEAPTERHFQTAWTMNLIRAALLALGLAASAPLISAGFQDPRLTSVLLAISVSVLLVGLGNPKVVVLTRQLVFWQEFALMVSQKVLGFAVSLGLALAYQSYWALVGGVIASQLAGVIVSYMIQPFRPKFTLVCARELWSFSIWLTLGQIVNTLNWKLDHLLIGRYLGPKALGVYTVGDNLAGLPTRETSGPIEQTLFPGFRTVAHDEALLRRTYQRSQALVSAIALPAGFGCAALAPLLVDLVLGPKWSEATLVVQVLACVFALQTMSSAVHPLALAKGRTQLMFQRDLQAFAMRVPIIAAGMWLGGMPGIIYARLISGNLSIGINMMVVQSLIGLSLGEQLRNTTRSLISAGVMYLSLQAVLHVLPSPAGWVEQLFTVAPLVLMGVSVYLGTHFALWWCVARPEGVETDVLNLVARLHQRLVSPKIL